MKSFFSLYEYIIIIAYLIINIHIMIYYYYTSGFKHNKTVDVKNNIFINYYEKFMCI